MAPPSDQTLHRPFGAHLEDHIVPKVDGNEVFICASPAVPGPGLALRGRTHEFFFRTFSLIFRAISPICLGLATSSSVT